jgi:hypothetical protein
LIAGALSIQCRSTERHSTQRQQYSAASTERHINSAPLELSAKVNSAAPNKKIHHQLSAVFLFTLTVHLLDHY